MEVQCWQLIHDDRHWKISLAVHTRHQTVQNQRVQRTDDLLLLRVVGNDQVRRMVPVGNLKVKVIPCEYPVCLW